MHDHAERTRLSLRDPSYQAKEPLQHGNVYLHRAAKHNSTVVRPGLFKVSKAAGAGARLLLRFLSTDSKDLPAFSEDLRDPSVLATRAS